MSKEKKFLEIVADILECELDDISFETELNGENGENWDSLAIVSFMAEADSEFGKTLTPTDVAAVKNIKALFDLI